MKRQKNYSKYNITFPFLDISYPQKLPFLRSFLLLNKLLYQSLIRVCDIASQVKSLAADPNDLSWMAEIHIFERVQFLRAVLTFA